MSNKSLTIVLPVYNGESRLTNCVSQVLELASELTSRFSILIVDDGSTDDTSAVAQELSARFPQIALRRNRQQRGLGPIISMVRRRVSSDVIIVHDGVTPIDTVEVRRLWQQNFDKQAGAGGAQCDIGELAHVRSTHDAMSKAHERLMGFQLVQPLHDEDAAAPSAAVTTTIHSPSRPQPTERSGVGQIPPLPRPNFLSAVAEFALGE